MKRRRWPEPPFTARILTRVGYPMGLKEAAMAMGEALLRDSVWAALEHVEAPHEGPAWHPPIHLALRFDQEKWLDTNSRAERDIARGILFAYCQRHHFGGSERGSQFEERPDLVGGTLRVWKVTRAWAGTREAGFGGGYWAPKDWEPLALVARRALTLFHGWTSTRPKEGENIVESFETTMLSEDVEIDNNWGVPPMPNDDLVIPG